LFLISLHTPSPVHAGLALYGASGILGGTTDGRPMSGSLAINTGDRRSSGAWLPFFGPVLPGFRRPIAGLRLFTKKAVLILLLLSSLTHLHAAPGATHDWLGELSLAGTLNSAGLALELELVRRFDISDPSAWLTSEANIGLGTFISLYPVGYHTALRLVVSPLLFLDAGVHAGVHGSWEMYRYTSLPVRYGEDERDGLPFSTENMAWLSPFLVLKAKFGQWILYNSFWFERYFGPDGWWLNWYHEAVMRDGWLINVNNYLMYEFSPRWRLAAFSRYWYVRDSRETKWLVGMAPSFLLGGGIRCTIGFGWHVREVNYDGIKVMGALSLPLEW